MSFMLINFIPSVSATGTDYDAPYRSGAGPTIDGNITSAEWSNITPYALTFQFNDTGNREIKADLYLLHNGSAVFIGINVTTGETNKTDAIIIYFDEDHNEQLTGTEPSEEGLKLLRNGTYSDLCYNDTKWFNDVDLGLTQGPSFGATDNDTIWEFIFPTTSADADFDVDLPSVTIERALEIGINIEYYNADLDMYDSCTTTANRTERMNADLWDDLVCGSLPEPPPNLNAIWIYIIIAMILPIAVVLYLLQWLIRKETD